MGFDYKKSLKVCFSTILLVLLAFSFSSFPVNAQSNEDIETQAGITPDNPVLWGLERFIEKIQLLLTFNQTKKMELRFQIVNERFAEMEIMLAKNNTEAAAKAEKARIEEIEIIGRLGVDNATEVNVTEKPIEEEPVLEITNATNVTCDYCQYLVNDTCLNYSCCKDDECKEDEYCSEHECLILECGECQYAENHECLDYGCCNDEDCAEGEVCSNNTCIEEKKCPSYCGEDTDCSIVYCNASTNYECKRILIALPCCGNQKCEFAEGENESSCPRDCEGVLEALYCEEDSDCVPCCASIGWDGEKLIVGGRNPFGTCINKNYTHLDVPAMCRSVCKNQFPPCISCNKCVNNQCITKEAPCPWD